MLCDVLNLEYVLHEVCITATLQLSSVESLLELDGLKVMHTGLDSR